MSATDGSVPWVQRSSRELGEFLCRPESKEVRFAIVAELRVRIVNETRRGARVENGSALDTVLELLGALSDRLDSIERRVAGLSEATRALENRSRSIF